ncbi:MAG: hypothetical protein ACFCUU_19365 [Cyclobacteriaceae bacterium]
MANIKRKSKKQFLFFSFAYLCLATYSWAQSPEAISYQAVIRNADNALIADKNVAIRISILQGNEKGEQVYSETHSVKTNAQGLMSIAIGEGFSSRGGFERIDWSIGPYFIKTETDPEGGTNYSIIGVSQIMTVPYALHAKTADNGISAELIKEIETNTAKVGFSNDLVSANPDVIANTAKIGITPGTAPGQMQFWNGSTWVTVQPGYTGQVLTFSNGVPSWTSTLGWQDVYNPATGKTWMDRNLGASRLATTSTDEAGYGDLYQWGRAADGHQVRTSGIFNLTATSANNFTPEHGDFIINPSTFPYDWHFESNDDLWQGVNGINNPCPSGYRLPTEAEFDEERLSWSNLSEVGAYASPLKLSMAGGRKGEDGELDLVDTFGFYWSSTTSGDYSRALSIGGGSYTIFSEKRSSGYSVRCIKD